MRLIYITVLMLLAVRVPALAQNPHWVWASGDAAANYNINPTYARQVIATSTHGHVLWGDLQNRKALYGQAALGDYRFREMDSMGHTLASFSAGGRFAALQATADTDGNWYVLGTFYDSVITGSLRLGRDSFGSTSSAFLCRLHAGTLAPDWLAVVGGNFSETNCLAVKGGYVYVAIDSFVATRFVKYATATGTPTTMWMQTGRTNTASIDVDEMGDVYVMGSCVLNGPLTFNGTASTVPSTINYPWFIARYRANGSVHWYQYLNDITCNDRGFRLKGNNAVYLSGMLSDSATLGGHSFHQPSSLFNKDYLLARLDSNGTLVWSQQRPAGGGTFGSIFFSTAVQTAVADSTVFMLSETAGAFDWSSSIVSTTVSNRHNATLTAYNANTGNVQWVKTIDGLSTYGQQIVSDDYSIWVTGVGTDSAMLRFDTVTVATGGGYQPYVAMMQVRNRSTSGGGTSTGIGHETSAKTVQVYPNPAQGFLLITGLDDAADLQLRDVNGRSLSCKGLSGTGSSRRVETATLARGIYFLEIRSNGGRQVQRVVLE